MTTAPTDAEPLRPNAETFLAGVIGDPVRHSRSPALHNAAFRALGLNGVYVAFEVGAADLEDALGGVRALGLLGLSVTMPYKAAVARWCDQATSTVERLGAANTVSFHAGVAVASSTDGEGLLDDLAEAEGFDPAGTSCAVIGAGGAARAVVLALADAGAAEVVVINRTPERAAVAAALAGGAGRVGVAEELSAARLVVNATPVGMAGVGEPGEPVADPYGRFLGSGQLVVDLVYDPAETPLLAAARSRGARTRNGLGMLVCQAARQVELWTGSSPPRAAMWAALDS